MRYIDRRLNRIVEDAAVVPPEGAAFFGQTYFIGNVNASRRCGGKSDRVQIPADTLIPRRNVTMCRVW